MDNGRKIYAALIHHPVIGRDGEGITAAVTNLDIHDLARLSKTYGLNGLYVVTPDKNQAQLAKSIINHWVEGFGATYNPDRMEALKLVKIADSLETVKKEICEIDKRMPAVISTSAARIENSVSFDKLRKIIDPEERSYLILFGTAYGLSREMVRESDYVLEPIDISGGYNHLSVRSAASIIIDRLLG